MLRPPLMPPTLGPLAIVTGGNRGLGRETCRQLAAQGRRVLLCARDGAAAKQAAEDLKGDAADGGSVTGHALDVTDAVSVTALAKHLRERGERIAALVNNAGISMRGFDADVVRGTLAVNFHGAARVSDTLWPLLAEDACVVNVSSGLGELSDFGAALRQRFLAPGLSRADLLALLAEFQASVERGDVSRQGWPRSAYNVSKAGLNALTRILARDAAEGVHVNAVCPGWVRTDMGGHSASRSVEDGARGIVWAAMLDADGPTGGFFRDGNAIDW